MPPTQRPVRFCDYQGDRQLVDEACHRRRRSRNPVDRAGWQGVQPGPAENGGTHAGRADLPVGQTELAQQRGHLGPTGDERLGTDVHRLAAQGLGAQYTTQPIGRVEYQDGGPIAHRAADAVGRRQTRNTSPDNDIGGAGGRAHNECTSATRSVITRVSVAGSTP